MADEHGHKQEFLIRNLPTRHVTLYPTKAQIIRDIDNVTLHPGANEITIYGITPTADESSIKVEGRGAATITDMMVDLVPNKQAYEDVYPESDAEDDDTYCTYDEDNNDDEPENEETKSITRELLTVDEEIKLVREDHDSASGQLSILEKYKNTVEERAPSDLTKFIQGYREERRKAFSLYHESESRMDTKREQRSRLFNRQRRALESLRKERAKLNKEKKLAAEKKARAHLERVDAKHALRQQRSLFWAKKVYRIVISLEASIETPATSRRGSIESLSTLRQEPNSADSHQISLSVSYVSSAASWAPRYDLSLNTSTATGTIIYGSEYSNATSETWKDAKVSLSTSEAAFQGLGQTTPAMVPWHIKLANGAHGSTAMDVAIGASLSEQEQNYKINVQAIGLAKANEPRTALFGLTGSNEGRVGGVFGQSVEKPQQPQQSKRLALQDYDMQLQLLDNQNRMRLQQAQMQQPQQMMQQQQQQQMMQQQQQQRMMQQPQQMMPMGQPQRQAKPSIFASTSAPGSGGFGVDVAGGAQKKPDATTPEASGFRFESGEDLDTLGGLPPLATEEATWAEEGLTFTYEIGVRTITPSFTQRRYRITSLHLKKVHLSYLLVPKLQPAAFLKARIQNSSSIALLRGMAGVTLDGAFLGNTTLPRCSAGESFGLSLGVDPAVQITYSKPATKRNRESGLFFTQKEDSYVFTRTCTIMNSKSRAIEGVMLDQVPLSQDEKLKVLVLEPSDVNEEGNSAGTGEAVAKDARKESGWGVAHATRKAGGEIRWVFKIEPSRGGKFVLEYETRYPGGESLVRA